MKNNIKKNSELHFNEIAKNYNNSHDGKFVKCMYDEIIDRVLKKQPKDILDLGCGNGNILSILKICLMMMISSISLFVMLHFTTIQIHKKF